MSTQIERNKQLVKNLITSKKPDAFIRKYQSFIYKVIDSQAQLIGTDVPMTADKKCQLMNDFIDNLLSKNLFDNYLCPRNGLQVPSLEIWIHLQSVNYFSARFIIDGIFSKDFNVTNRFFFSSKRPGCWEIFSNWIFKNKVYKANKYVNSYQFVEKEIQDYVSILYAGIDKFLAEEAEIKAGTRRKHSTLKEYENAGLTTLARFSYRGNFYCYFKDHIIAPYLKRKYFEGKNQFVYIEDTGEDERQMGIASSDNISQDQNSRDFLEQIFQIMKRTEAGRRQVEVLTLLNLQSFDGDMLSDEKIAEMLNLSVANLRTIHSRGLNTAREIAKTLKMKSI